MPLDGKLLSAQAQLLREQERLDVEHEAVGAKIRKNEAGGPPRVELETALRVEKGNPQPTSGEVKDPRPLAAVPRGTLGDDSPPQAPRANREVEPPIEHLHSVEKEAERHAQPRVHEGHPIAFGRRHSRANGVTFSPVL